MNRLNRDEGPINFIIWKGRVEQFCFKAAPEQRQWRNSS